MAVNLSIIKSPPGVALEEERKSFGPDGGVIGRGAGNDWVLGDPERFLSSKHCQVSKEGDRYFLTDLSTNGTFVNGSQEALGRGSRVALNDGDTVDLGDYRFKVSIERELDDVPGSPFAADDIDFGATAPGLGAAPQVDVAKPAPESMYMSGEYNGAVSDITPEEMKITDPLLALDRAEGVFEKPAQTQASNSNAMNLGGSQEDSADLLRESADWPQAKPEQALLPDDWDDDISLLGKRSSQLKGSTPNILADEDALIAPKSPSPGEDKGAKLNATAPSSSQLTSTSTKASAEQAKPRAKKAAPPRPAPRKAPTAPARPSSQSGSGRVLLEALGLGQHDISDEQMADIEHTVGTMMKETVEGLMQVLRSRASIKNEFRMNVTTIQPVENNPIKFSANAEEVLEIMFLRQSRAYKQPVEAVQESFNTIADHQVAVIAGIRSAFKSAMLRFDPVILEEEFKKSGKGGLLSGLSKGKFWAAYQEHYQEVINDIERSFQEMFGDEFVQAYEDQLRKLASARKRDL